MKTSLFLHLLLVLNLFQNEVECGCGLMSARSCHWRQDVEVGECPSADVSKSKLPTPQHYVILVRKPMTKEVHIHVSRLCSNSTDLTLHLLDPGTNVTWILDFVGPYHGDSRTVIELSPRSRVFVEQPWLVDVQRETLLLPPLTRGLDADYLAIIRKSLNYTGSLTVVGVPSGVNALELALSCSGRETDGSDCEVRTSPSNWLAAIRSESVIGWFEEKLTCTEDCSVSGPGDTSWWLHLSSGSATMSTVLLRPSDSWRGKGRPHKMRITGTADWIVLLDTSDLHNKLGIKSNLPVTPLKYGGRVHGEHLFNILPNSDLETGHFRRVKCNLGRKKSRDVLMLSFPLSGGPDRMRDLRSAITTRCSEKTMDVILDGQTVENLGLTGAHFTLNKPSCGAVHLDTQYHLQAGREQELRCGSLITTRWRRTDWSNSLNVWVNRTGERRLIYACPLVCRVKRASFKRRVFSPGPRKVLKGELYTLALDKWPPSVDNQTRTESCLHVLPNETLRAQITVNPLARQKIGLIIKSCFLSPSVNYSDQKHRIYILWNGCLFSNKVQWFKDNTMSPGDIPSGQRAWIKSLSFSAIFAPDSLRRWYQTTPVLYLHCSILPCLVNMDLDERLPPRCASESMYCALPQLYHEQPLHKLTSKPFSVLMDPAYDSTRQSGRFLDQSVFGIHGDVPPWHVILIGFCSFFLGTGLTLVLIYIRRVTQHRKCSCCSTYHSNGALRAENGSIFKKTELITSVPSSSEGLLKAEAPCHSSLTGCVPDSNLTNEIPG